MRVMNFWDESNLKVLQFVVVLNWWDDEVVDPSGFVLFFLFFIIIMK